MSISINYSIFITTILHILQKFNYKNMPINITITHVVVDIENNVEENFNFAHEARQRLCRLAEQGINAYIYKEKTI